LFSGVLLDHEILPPRCEDAHTTIARNTTSRGLRSVQPTMRGAPIWRRSLTVRQGQETLGLFSPTARWRNCRSIPRYLG